MNQAYIGLLALDNQTLLLSYDRLAHGWHGPPGRLGDSDFVFAMRLTIKPDQRVVRPSPAFVGGGAAS